MPFKQDIICVPSTLYRNKNNYKLQILLYTPYIEDISALISKIDDTTAGMAGGGVGTRPPRKCSNEDTSTPSWFQHKKHFFIFSYSGKPIYSRYGDELALNTFMASMSAMSSFIESQNDVLSYLTAGSHKFVFLQKDPLVLVCISRKGEPYSVIKQQLEYIHGLVISVLTQTSIKAIFDAKYDLRDLLGGTDRFIDNIIHKSNRDPSILLNSVHCLRLPNNIRNIITNSLQNHRNDTDLQSENIQEELIKAVNNQDYTVSQTDIPNLLHFLYKSRSSGYATYPVLTPPYSINKQEQKSQTETLIVAVQNNHELYATFSPLELKKNVLESFAQLLQWIKEYENVLFIN
eukprot:gene832-1039_t